MTIVVKDGHDGILHFSILNPISIMVYKDFSNMAVDHFGHLPFVWKFKDRYLMMAGYWFVTLITVFFHITID